MDTTGNQWMLADAVEKEYGAQGIHRVRFTGTASKDPISVQDPRPASEIYQNFVTELWGRFGVYVQNDMIRGLCDEACKEFSTRMLDYSTKDQNKVVIESKVVLHDRLGFSPDHADAAVIAVDVVRKVLNVLPEEAKGSQGVAMDDFEKLEQIAVLADEDGFEGKKHKIPVGKSLFSVFQELDGGECEDDYFGNVGLL
jgi:hypothetical protein